MNGDALREPYDNYSDEEIAALKEFNAAGGMVILAGWSDYYESYKDFPEAEHMAAQQNKILEALGSSPAHQRRRHGGRHPQRRSSPSGSTSPPTTGITS